MKNRSRRKKLAITIQNQKRMLYAIVPKYILVGAFSGAVIMSIIALLVANGDFLTTLSSYVSAPPMAILAGSTTGIALGALSGGIAVYIKIWFFHWKN